MKHIYSMLIGFLCFASLTAQTEVELVESTVSKANIKGHIYFLADDLLKGRETGTPENKIAASYLANTLRGYGVKPNPKTGNYYQEVFLQKTSPGKKTLLSLNGKNIKKVVAIQREPLEYNGEVIFLGHGLEEDYDGKNVSGKLIIVKAGKPGATDARTAFGLRNQKSELAEKAGALGVIELVETTPQIWGNIEHSLGSSRLEVAEEKDKEQQKGPVYFWVLDEKGEMVNQFSNTGSFTAKVELDAEVQEAIVSQNVIGIVEGTDPQLKNEYIIYSGHYDHVGIGAADETGDTIYNGARDNAVGTTTVLSMAENLAKYPTKRSALFILFTAEEKGLLGSQYYVENPVLPLEQMVFGFNSDNAGYNDTSVATIIGLERTTASQHIKEAAQTFGITAIDDPAPDQNLFDRSDNVHFAAKGIPAPTFSLGFKAFDGDVTKYYHRPGDEAHTLDFEYLHKFFQAYVLAGRKIANDPKTPFWTAGDTYEPAGQKLYNRN